MSQVEPKAKEAEIPAGWRLDGESAKGYPVITDGNSRRTLVNGGWINADGNPGHEGAGGRPPKLTRESLTEAAGQAHEPYVKLRNDWLAKAQAFLDAGDIDKADRAQKAADRIQEGYMRYGIGSKQEVTLGNPEVVRKVMQAYRDMGHTPEQAVAFNDKVVAALDG